MTIENLWLPMLRSGGEWRVARLHNGSVEYLLDPVAGQPWSGKSRLLARRKAERLNVAELPSRCTAEELDDMVRGLYVTPRMKSALDRLLVHGQPWSRACENAGVTESGLLRALRRIAARKMSEIQQ